MHGIAIGNTALGIYRCTRVAGRPALAYAEDDGVGCFVDRWQYISKKFMPLFDELPSQPGYRATTHRKALNA